MVCGVGCVGVWSVGVGVGVGGCCVCMMCINVHVQVFWQPDILYTIPVGSHAEIMLILDSSQETHSYAAKALNTEPAPK